MGSEMTSNFQNFFSSASNFFMFMKFLLGLLTLYVFSVQICFYSVFIDFIQQNFISTRCKVFNKILCKSRPKCYLLYLQKGKVTGLEPVNTATD